MLKAARDIQYWIKPGMLVKNKYWPTIKMVVDEIKRSKQIEQPSKSETLSDGEKIAHERKTYVRHVSAHWITTEGLYQEGKFHTTELEPWEKSQS